MKKLLLLTALILFLSCEKDKTVRPEPRELKPGVKVTTLSPIRVGQAFATVAGKVENIDDYSWSYGFSYGESKGMRLNSTSVKKGSANTFTATIRGLYPGKTYYYNVYVNYGETTIQGEVKSFTTVAF